MALNKQRQNIFLTKFDWCKGKNVNPNRLTRTPSPATLGRPITSKEKEDTANTSGKPIIPESGQEGPGLEKPTVTKTQQYLHLSQCVDSPDENSASTSGARSVLQPAADNRSRVPASNLPTNKVSGLRSLMDSCNPCCRPNHIHSKVPPVEESFGRKFGESNSQGKPFVKITPNFEIELEPTNQEPKKRSQVPPPAQPLTPAQQLSWAIRFQKLFTEMDKLSTWPIDSVVGWGGLGAGRAWMEIASFFKNDPVLAAKIGLPGLLIQAFGTGVLGKNATLQLRFYRKNIASFKKNDVLDKALRDHSKLLLPERHWLKWRDARVGPLSILTQLAAFSMQIQEVDPHVIACTKLTANALSGVIGILQYMIYRTVKRSAAHEIAQAKKALDNLGNAGAEAIKSLRESSAINVTTKLIVANVLVHVVSHISVKFNGHIAKMQGKSQLGQDLGVYATLAAMLNFIGGLTAFLGHRDDEHAAQGAEYLNAFSLSIGTAIALYYAIGPFLKGMHGVEDASGVAQRFKEESSTWQRNNPQPSLPKEFETWLNEESLLLAQNNPLHAFHLLAVVINQFVIAQSDPSQSDPSQPGTSQPGTSQPDPSQPDPSQPDPSQPGTSQPGTSQPGGTSSAPASITQTLRTFLTDMKVPEDKITEIFGVNTKLNEREDLLKYYLYPVASPGLLLDPGEVLRPAEPGETRAARLVRRVTNATNPPLTLTSRKSTIRPYTTTKLPNLINDTVSI